MDEPSEPRYGVDFSEERQLTDGTRVKLRFAQPTDKDEFRRAFEELSVDSRYQRFFTVQSQLTDDMLEYLTNVDGWNHVAVVASVESADLKTEKGLGVARFVRLAEDPRVAEAAVTVVDHAQGKGLGRALLEVLAGAAKERDVHTFRGEVLRTNKAMRGLLEEAGAVVRKDEGDTLVFDAHLDDEEDVLPMSAGHRLRRLLRAAARVLALRGDAK